MTETPGENQPAGQDSQLRPERLGSREELRPERLGGREELRPERLGGSAELRPEGLGEPLTAEEVSTRAADGYVPEVDLRLLEVTVRIDTHVGEGLTDLDFQVVRSLGAG